MAILAVQFHRLDFFFLFAGPGAASKQFGSSFSIRIFSIPLFVRSVVIDKLGGAHDRVCVCLRPVSPFSRV